MVGAGPRRHTVVVEAPAPRPERDGPGSVVEAWVVVGTRSVQIEPLSAREVVFAQQIESQATHRVTMRYCPWLTSRHRFRWRGRILNIVGPPQNTGGKDSETVVLCTEVEGAPVTA
jgi:SPP1 family predicted phage head-tail adaptor